MLTEKDYCDYDTCVALKELGYPLTSKEVRYEDKAVFAPSVLLYTAQKWLRKEKGIEIVVHSFDYVGEPYFADIHMYREVRCACSYADSYEEALLEGIKETIKHIEII